MGSLRYVKYINFDKMKLLIVAATELEIAPFLSDLDTNGQKISFFDYQYFGHEISTLITGIGSLRTAFALATLPSIGQYGLIINAGIAGAKDDKLSLGSCYEVTRDQFGDLGVEDKDGSFISVFDLGFDSKDATPFKNGFIYNSNEKYSSNLKKVTSVSFNMVSGSAEEIAKRYSRVDAQLESMEGAGFAYAASCLRLPYIQVRAVSNYVEPRDRAKWKINDAVDNLNDGLINFVKAIKS
jgi:futalosine hydrolase